MGRWWVGVGCVIYVSACGGSVDDESGSGSLGAACASDDACGDGLVCRQGECAMADVSTGGTGGDKPVSSGGTPNGGAASGGVSTGAGGIVAAGGFMATGGYVTGGGSTAGGAAQGGAGWVQDGGSAPLECTPNDPTLSECNACVHTYCCAELSDCTQSVECSGDGVDEGELACIIECMDAVAVETGVATQDDLVMCASSCAWGGDLIAPSTEALVTCMTSPGVDGGSGRCSEFSCLGLFSQQF